MRPFVPLLLVSLTLASCSGDDPVAPQPPPPSGLGTPLTAIGALEAQTPLLWSAATNEIVAVASFNNPNPNALIAVGAGATTLRTLDARAATPLALAPDGGAAYYMTFDIDSTVARRVTLTGAAAAARLAYCDGSCEHAVVPSPDGNLVAVRSQNTDSIHVVTVSTGARDTITSGWPLIYRSDGARLFKKELGEDWDEAVVYDLGTRATTPGPFANFPRDSVLAFSLRWDAATGIQMLYVSADKRRLILRTGSSAPEVVYVAPDTIEAHLDWAPTGHAAAFWTSRASGSGRRYELRAVLHPAAGAIPVVVAYTTEPIGGVAVSANSVGAAYVVDRRLYRSVIPTGP